MNLETLSKNWRGAVLLIFRPGDPRPMRRSAVFLYQLAGGGFAWVEPSYLDPLGPAAPALHSRPRATYALLNPAFPDVGVSYEDPETGESGMVYPWRPEDWPAVPELEAFYAQADEAGLDLRDERDRVRPALSVAPGA